MTTVFTVTGQHSADSTQRSHVVIPLCTCVHICSVSQDNFPIRHAGVVLLIKFLGKNCCNGSYQAPSLSCGIGCGHLVVWWYGGMVCCWLGVFILNHKLKYVTGMALFICLNKLQYTTSNLHVASFPGLPRFCSSVCTQYNTRKQKSAKNGEGLVSSITWVNARWT